MNITVGKANTDGTVRSIEVTNKQCIIRLVNILQNFYCRVERIERLLDLGDLYRLGPSLSCTYQSEDDKVHCQTFQSKYNSSSVYKARTVADRQIFLEENRRQFVMLFENGKWTAIYRKCESDSRLVDHNFYITKADSLDRLHAIKLNGVDYAHADLDKSSWAAILESARSYQAPVYIYRGRRLILNINTKY